MLNFSPGPSQLPKEVIKRLQKDFKEYANASIMELSHRSDTFLKIYEEAVLNTKSLYDLGEDYEVLFLPGGASFNFALIPLNFMEKSAQYAISGVFAKKAFHQALLLDKNAAKIAASSEVQGFASLPKLSFDENADYAYLCSNNTIYGTQYKSYECNHERLFIDATSDIFSKKLDFKNIGLLFAGTQKNAGIAGLGCVIIKKELLEISAKKELLSMLKYSTYAENDSMFNTPPTFAIYVFMLVTRWLKDMGGLANIAKLNQKKASLIYELIDSSKGFYKGYASKEARSLMNISFKLASTKLDELFVQKSLEAGLLGLKGHKLLGGIRASIYNSLSFEEAVRLCEFMDEFRNLYKE